MQLTVSQIEANLQEWQSTYSDLFKGLHGFRPRLAFLNTAEAIADFMNSYEEELLLSQEREECELEALREQHGRHFISWSAYYDWLELNDQRAHQEWLAEREQQENFHREFHRSASPLPHIIAWEHGDRDARCARA